jgi:small subunit ribosomal protein S4e
MARGPKKHLKRIRTPKSWLLDKLTGVYAPRPRTGPHKLKECLPLQIVLRNRLKYALTGRECDVILHDKDNEVKIDNKVRRDKKYPVGLMDTLSIKKTGDYFRMLYDIKGRFALTKIKEKEANIKLCKIKKRVMGQNKVPYVVTHDARTIRFPDPSVRLYDTVKVDLTTGQITDTLKLELGKLVLVTGGANRGRVGIINNRTRLQGAFDMINIRDANGNSFNTRIDNCFVIGEKDKSIITLPRGAGLKSNIIEQQDEKFNLE